MIFTLMPCFPYWNIFLCLFSLDPWHSAGHQSKEQVGHSSLSCLSEPLIFLNINHSLECTFTVGIFRPPYSPPPATVPSWHQFAKQYFPYPERRACHRLFDMVWEPTENHWCTNHFYSTRLWEPRGISSLSARVNTPHTYKPSIPAFTV